MLILVTGSKCLQNTQKFGPSLLTLRTEQQVKGWFGGSTELHGLFGPDPVWNLSWTQSALSDSNIYVVLFQAERALLASRRVKKSFREQQCGDYLSHRLGKNYILTSVIGFLYILCKIKCIGIIVSHFIIFNMDVVHAPRPKLLGYGVNGIVQSDLFRIYR